jgi:hypothetical protein
VTITNCKLFANRLGSFGSFLFACRRPQHVGRFLGFLRILEDCRASVPSLHVSANHILVFVRELCKIGTCCAATYSARIIRLLRRKLSNAPNTALTVERGTGFRKTNPKRKSVLKKRPE